LVWLLRVISSPRSHLGGDGLEGGGIQELSEVALFASFLIGLFHSEELVVEAQFDIGGMGGADPVDGAFDLRAAEGPSRVRRPPRTKVACWTRRRDSVIDAV
jgi:hypothetical protein